MSKTTDLKVVFGGALINDGRALADPAILSQAFDLLLAAGITTIDTAAFYGRSEAILGEAKTADRGFTIDTKTCGGWIPHGASKANILREAKTSQDHMGPVDVFYIHAPDPDTPIEETLSAINEVHKTGFFQRFGLSNYKAEDVERIYNLCKEKGYPLPAVYQGNYSAIARKQEQVLFPTLRKLGISFYAYSPLAGGFLSKTREQIAEGSGRFTVGEDGKKSNYMRLYGSKSELLDALERWAKIAKDEGVSRADLAYRWVRFHSALKAEHGDAMIIGASSVPQLEETLKCVEGGPLSEQAVKSIDAFWKEIEHAAPLDNYHD